MRSYLGKLALTPFNNTTNHTFILANMGKKRTDWFFWGGALVIAEKSERPIGCSTFPE
jgi:hypothetical protein